MSRFLLRIRILRTASPAEVLQVLSSWNVVTRGTSAKDPAVRHDSFSNEHNAMDNLDSNTFVLSANCPQEPQARYREYTLRQDLLACNKQYGIDPTRIKDLSSMASLPDRRTTPTNLNYSGVESPSPLHRDSNSQRRTAITSIVHTILIVTSMKIRMHMNG